MTEAMTEAMTEYEKKWNEQYEKLLDFKQKNGHCEVPAVFVQDKALGSWVSRQRSIHVNNTMRQDRMEVLDKIGFVWKADNILARVAAGRAKGDEKRWLQQYKKLVELKRNNGHCVVPFNYEQDKSLGRWFHTQRNFHAKNKIRLDRKELLDEIGFVWKASDDIAARRSSTTDDVRYLVIWIISRFLVKLFFSHSFCACLICVGFGPGSRHHQQCGSTKRSTGRNGTITKPH
jgi:hypothetical protein